MSALLEKPVIRERKSPKGTTTARKPATQTHLRLQARIIQKKRTNYGPLIVGKVVMFSVLLGVTFMVSSFGGQVLLEGARQERMDAKRRAFEAKAAESVLALKLDKIVSAGGVEEWALAHDFVLIDPTAGRSGLIARR